MHTKALTLEYPRTDIKKFPVPSEFVDWKVPFPKYKPVDYTAETVLRDPPWADPDIRLEFCNGHLQFDKCLNISNLPLTKK